MYSDFFLINDQSRLFFFEAFTEELVSQLSKNFTDKSVYGQKIKQENRWIIWVFNISGEYGHELLLWLSFHLMGHMDSFPK